MGDQDQVRVQGVLSPDQVFAAVEAMLLQRGLRLVALIRLQDGGASFSAEPVTAAVRSCCGNCASKP